MTRLSVAPHCRPGKSAALSVTCLHKHHQSPHAQLRSRGIGYGGVVQHSKVECLGVEGLPRLHVLLVPVVVFVIPCRAFHSAPTKWKRKRSIATSNRRCGVPTTYILCLGTSPVSGVSSGPASRCDGGGGVSNSGIPAGGALASYGSPSADDRFICTKAQRPKATKQRASRGGGGAECGQAHRRRRRRGGQSRSAAAAHSRGPPCR